MKVTDGTLGAFGVIDATHAFWNHSNACLTHVTGCGVNPVPIAAFYALS